MANGDTRASRCIRAPVLLERRRIQCQFIADVTLLLYFHFPNQRNIENVAIVQYRKAKTFCGVTVGGGIPLNFLGLFQVFTAHIERGVPVPQELYYKGGKGATFLICQWIEVYISMISNCPRWSNCTLPVVPPSVVVRLRIGMQISLFLPCRFDAGRFADTLGESGQDRHYGFGVEGGSRSITFHFYWSFFTVRPTVYRKDLQKMHPN